MRPQKNQEHLDSHEYLEMQFSETKAPLNSESAKNFERVLKLVYCLLFLLYTSWIGLHGEADCGLIETHQKAVFWCCFNYNRRKNSNSKKYLSSNFSRYIGSNKKSHSCLSLSTGGTLFLQLFPVNHQIITNQSPSAISIARIGETSNF